MPTRIKPYGLNKARPPGYSPYYYDVADAQDLLPKGFRIRNKKAKRRLHKKRTRQLAKADLRKELATR